MKLEKQTWRLCALGIISAIIYVFSIHFRMGNALPDDAAFFLRYAENMAHGEYWVWNLGESPVWGASAPLFPLLLILPLKLGVDPTAAIIWTSTFVSVVSLTACSLMLAERFGLLAGIAFTVLSSLDTGLMYFAGSGLESPLTYAMLVFALYALLYRKSDVMVGLAAGLLAVQKLDLVPVAGLLLIAHFVMLRKLAWRGVFVALIIAATWYCFARFWFGAPVPNSFLTKAFHQNDFHRSIEWTWFANSLLFRFSHWIYVLLACLGIWKCSKRHFPVVLFALGAMCVHVAAYSIKYPFEPYDWYYMPALMLLTVLASLGVAQVASIVQLKKNLPEQFAGICGVALLLAIVVHLWSFERADTESRINWLNTVEFDRAEAGRWVNEHTPQYFKVATAWGNPALYSGRYVYDWSFLNRHYESGNLIEKYRPEIIIMQNAEDSTPKRPAKLSDDYEAVRVFDSGLAAGEGNIFFVVYARKDLIGKITGVSFPLKTACKSEDDCDKYQPLSLQKATSITLHSPASETSSLCAVDLVNDVLFAQSKQIHRAHPVTISGWSIMSGDVKALPEEVHLEFSNGTAAYSVRARSQYPRADVPHALNLPVALTNSGFRVLADLSTLTDGNYSLSVVMTRGNTRQTCGPFPVALSQ
ncbi:hypothetical protein [Paraburkholderia unamae]|uniref:Glycosyltransferase RgtA/B/C/D-like domain-containing protein n=1 Tax=Paraburkholderia unamae TaxID=219649 RepID=A0ABX5KN35_9BURK|nr:hypothetical protein [Paraburkholderia unamae]PVX82291.1 hypothetical protein C7402_109144 [Paraburkholderia unamae]